MCRRLVRSVPIIIVMLVAVIPARGQAPSIAQRSGLVSRFVPIQPTLPPDPDRDTFYDTKWADDPYPHRPNSICHDGLYGLPWRPDCTACVSPYFAGIPGQSTLGLRCRPCPPFFRLAQNLAHPFKPVGSYYAGGCYVPIYDLDPIVTGPGPYPWPHFLRRPTGG